MTSLKKASVYAAALAASSLVLLFVLKFAAAAGPLLLSHASPGLPIAVLMIAVVLGNILRSRKSFQLHALVVRRRFRK